MDLETSQTQPNTQATESQPTPTPTPSESTPQATSEAPPTEAPAYTPNHEYFVNGKRQEFDEFLRGAVTKKEHEEQLRQLYTKAHGIDEIKSARDRMQEQYTQLKSEYTPLQNEIAQVKQYLSQGDIESVRRFIGIPKDQLLKWAVNEVNMDDGQRQWQDQQYKYQTKQQQYESQLQQIQAQNQQLTANQREFELKQSLSRPDVASIVGDFNRRNGQGAFEAEVIRRGQAYWYQQQVDVPPDKLVEEIVRTYGLQGQGQMPMPGQQSNQPPVIPNVGGSGSQSPIVKKPKSAAELRVFGKNING